MLASAVPRLMGTKVTSSSSASSLLSSPDTEGLAPPAAAAAAAAALRVLRGVTEPPGVLRGVAGVSLESAGCSWNTKPVALHSTAHMVKQVSQGQQQNPPSWGFAVLLNIHALGSHTAAACVPSLANITQWHAALTQWGSVRPPACLSTTATAVSVKAPIGLCRCLSAVQYLCVYSTTSLVTGRGLKSHSILVGNTRALPTLRQQHSTAGHSRVV